MTANQYKNKIPDVQTLPCPATKGHQPHLIEARGVNQNLTIWACIHCKVSWADLDAQFRATLPVVSGIDS